MNDRMKKLLCLGLPAVLILLLLLAWPGYCLIRELEYRTGTPTQAEQAVHDHARKQGIPYGRYPKALIELLGSNPETRDFVLQYPFRQEADPDISGYSRDSVPLFLQWDPMWGYERYGSGYLAVTGCGPTCLAMAGYFLTGDINMTPGQIAAFAEKNGYYAPGYGSSWTLISEGGEKLGLQVRELPLVKKKLVTALEAGSLVILALGPGDFTTEGHYILLTGTEEDGFRVNDPNSRENSGPTNSWNTRSATSGPYPPRTPPYRREAGEYCLCSVRCAVGRKRHPFGILIKSKEAFLDLDCPSLCGQYKNGLCRNI